MINTASVPIIDIGPYLCANATASEQAKVIDDVRNACCEYGFLQVEGHGVPADVQKRMLDACKILFDLPQGQKDALSLKKSPARRGYETIGEQVLDAEALPDMKEVCPKKNFSILIESKLTPRPGLLCRPRGIP